MVSIDIEPDVVLKDFFRKRERFASFVNAVLFQGKCVVLPRNVYECDSLESMIIDKSVDSNEQEVRSRDVIRKVWIRGGFVLIAIENQGSSQRKMVARCGVYDMLRYLKQSENSHDIYGVITIVLFTGEYRWNRPTTLHELISEIPEEVKSFIPDWKMHLVDIKDIDATLVNEQDMKTLIEGVQMVYQIHKNPEEILLKPFMMTKEIALYVATITGFPEFLEKAKLAQEGEKIDMCDSLNSLRSYFQEQGVKIGEQRGIEIGEQRGIEIGEKKGLRLGAEQERERNTLVQKKNIQTMITKGFDISTIAECLSLSEKQVNAYIQAMPVH